MAYLITKIAFPRAVLVILVALVAGLPNASAQPLNADITYSRQPVFRIPFDVEPGARPLREVQLYVSEDQGATWQKVVSAPPDQKTFGFRAERNGMHWFTVRTIDIDGRISPPTMQGARPQIKVVVDTQPPVITLRPAAGQEGTVGVTWDIRDDNLDLASFTLEYRLPGSADWLSLPVTPAATGQRFWPPGTNGAVDVRLRVRDLARNENEAKLTLTTDGQAYRSANTLADQDNPSSPARTMPDKRFVNSKQLSLDYEIKEEGPSGVSVVELWATTDGRNWQRYKEDKTHQPPLVFEVNGEGVYGFSLVVRSGVNQCERAPRPGDQPQIWVEVDLTKPVVKWLNVDVGRGLDAGKVTITWNVTDKNLGREPIKLSYQDSAKDPQGSWTTIESNLENTGRYVWQTGPTVPYSFHVRVEATDKAGNVGSKDTANPVIVDLHIPKGFIKNVEPAKGMRNEN